MAIIKVPYTGGVAPITIVDMWAAGLRSTEIHRAIDWDGQSGTFEEYTNNGGGARPSLVEDQEAYSFYDDSGDASYAYMVRHRSPAGKLTVFSDVITVGDGLVVMSAQQVWARYVHPSGYAGTWAAFEPRNVRMTSSRMNSDGNQPYVSGTDYTLEVALLYRAADGTWKGVDLTGATEIVVTVTLADDAGTFDRKLSEGKIAVLDQSTEHPVGTRGHLQVLFANTDTIAVGEHVVECDATFTGGKIVEQFRGLFGVAA